MWRDAIVPRIRRSSGGSCYAVRARVGCEFVGWSTRVDACVGDTRSRGLVTGFGVWCVGTSDCGGVWHVWLVEAQRGVYDTVMTVHSVGHSTVVLQLRLHG